MPEISSIKLNAERANSAPAVGGVSTIAKTALEATSSDRTNQQGNAASQTNTKTDTFGHEEQNISDYTKYLQSSKESTQKKNTDGTEAKENKIAEENSQSNPTGETEEKQKNAVGENLSSEEQAQVDELRSGDKKVKNHEAAHAAVGGELVRGKSFDYAVGPDGKRYAIGGEVQIDISPVADDPEATIQKMQQIRRAALAPSDPSPQDRSVASTAQSIESQAQAEITSRIGKNGTASESVAEASANPLDAGTATKAYTKKETENAMNGSIFDSISSPNDIKNLTGTSGSLSE